MVEAKATWTEEERFLAVASSGHPVQVDAGPEKTAPGPMELVLIGLCACTASDVVTILRKKREAFTTLEVSAQGERAADPPRVYTSIRLRYRVGGQVSRKAVDDAVRLSMEKYCSVSAMLKRTAKVEYEIELV
jgi:putative redox protein